MTGRPASARGRSCERARRAPTPAGATEQPLRAPVRSGWRRDAPSLRPLPGDAPDRERASRQAPPRRCHAAGRRAGPLRAGAVADLRAGAGGRFEPASGSAAAPAAAVLRLPRAQRPAADPPDRLRPRAPAQPRRPDLRGASSTCLLHRFALFFYRAWAQAQPVVGLDRPRRRARSPPRRRAGRPDRARDAQPRRARRPRRSCTSPAGWRARCATPTAWRRGCGCSSTCRCSVEQFQRPLDAARPRGAHAPAARRPARPRPRRRARRRVWDVQHKFRIVIGPLRWERFAALLPGRRGRSRSCARWCASTSASSSPGTCA